MKVFYVMVLLLVAGVVPSHGGTKSESTTVFNKMQPHESMKNKVTVSSSKQLVTYGKLVLAMQWPGSFCYFRECHQQVPNRFTVHGLWPQSSDGGRIDCQGPLKAGNYLPFDINKLDPGLVLDLNRFWPDLTASQDRNQEFWSKEYNKHGSCTFNNQTEYFNLTITMVQNRGDLIGMLEEQGIFPGKSYFPTDIRNAVYEVTKVWPTLQCRTVNSNGSSQLTDCTADYCNGTRMTLLPRNDSMPYSPESPVIVGDTPPCLPNVSSKNFDCT